MQRKPGVAFIPKADEDAVKHPLNHGGASEAANFSYRFLCAFPAFAPRINQSINQSIQRRKQ